MNIKNTKKIIEINDSDNEEKEKIMTIYIKSDSDSDEEFIEEKEQKQKSNSKKTIDLSDPSKKNKSVTNNDKFLSKKRNEKKEKEKSENKPKKKSKMNNLIEYKKGKFNTRIALIEKDDNLDEKDDQVNNTCCVVCSNRNCIRAAKTKNYTLMQNCINDCEHISSLINPYSIGTENVIEIGIKNNDRKMIELIFNNIDKPRCYKENPKIKLVDTGENSEFMVGVRTRKLNQTRGNKMGNDAFLRDDIETNKNDIVNIVCRTITEKCEDPSFIDFLKSLKFNNSNNKNNTNINYAGNQRYYNYSNNFNFTFESFVINAVLKGNIKIAKYLLKDLDKLNNFGFNALHYDVLAKSKADDISIKVKTSLTKKPQTNYGMTPMHVACINPDVSYIKKLVELDGDWNVMDNLHRKPLHYAACCKGDGPINYLLSLGALVNEVDKEKKSALMYACISGRLDCVKALINKKANILLKDKLLSNTAFHYACKYGYKNIVEYFLQNTDIKVDLPGEERMTGLMLASLYGHFELVQFLIEHKAKLTKKDKFKRTPLLHAVRGGQLKIVNYLLTKGAEYEFPDSSNNTPLHYACAYGFQEIAKILIKGGASPNPSNDWKYTPLEIGFLKNHLGIVKFLLDYVDVNVKFNLDMRLIHYSFKKITKKVVDEEMRFLIIDKQCDINVQDYYGKSIIHYLAEFTYDKFCQDNVDYNYKYNNKTITQQKYKELLLKIFNLLKKRIDLNINLLDKQGKAAFQVAIEKKNFDFIEEILKLNLDLSLISQNTNSIIHSLVSFVFDNKITIEKKINVINIILDKLKSVLSDNELNKICNSYDDNGFTPLLKLMYEYHQNINSVFTTIKNEETYEYKKEKLLQKNDNINNPFLNNNFNNNLGFDFGNKSYNNNTLENQIASYVLNLDEIKLIQEKSMEKLNKFIDFILFIIKKFISLKMDPMIKVGKLLKYRERNKNIDANKDNNKDINFEIKEDKESADVIDDNNKLYVQYFDNQGENSILLYLMKYPNKKLLDYFIKELKIPINVCNIYNKNSLYFLFDNISLIDTIQNNTSYVIDILYYLMDQGINIEQIDHLGNNPFLYLAMNNFNVNVLKILSINKCDINKFNKDDYNSLFFYIRQKNLNIVKTLIEDFKVDYTLCDSKKRTIMHYLCNDEISSTDMDERLCDYLLTKKIALNQPDVLGRIPIHYLFVKINDEYNSNDIDPVTTLTKFLEYNEVDAGYKDIYGNTPLHYACQRGSIISVISLGGKKIDYDVKNKENNSPLAYSLLFKKENVAINLIQQKVDLDQFIYPLNDRNESKLIDKNANSNYNINNSNMSNLANNNIYNRKGRKRPINNNITFSNNNYFGNNPFNSNNNNPFGNINNSLGDNNPFNSNSNPFGTNLGNNNNYTINNNDTINNNIFKDKINKKGIKLFRLCIKNNFQGLTHLFITRGYSLNKAVEDCFYEQKFNLAKKLLTRSPYNETYQGLNLDGQNLFHIIGNIKNNSNNEALPEFFQILLSKEISLDLKDNFGNTPLHYGAQNLYQDFIKFIVNKYPNKKRILNMKNNDNNTPFNLATKGNNINLINKDIFNYLFTNKDINKIFEQDEKLINNNISKKTTYKCSLLLLIIRKILNLEKSLEQSNLFYFYKKLIEGGASIFEKDTYGRTCLNYAVIENNLKF